VSAQESCGDFIYLDSFYEDYIEPVDDCGNPFEVVDGDRFGNVTIQIDGQEISESDVLVYEQLPVNLGPTVSFDGDATFTDSGFELFYHSGEDYISDYTLNVSATGTYTLVHTISEQPQQQVLFTPWERVWSWLIPVASAQFGFDPLERTAVTFSIGLTEPEPTGASSVLFLPGIMGSKLYEQGQQCGDSGNEQQRWFSTSACEQLRLLTRFDGKSLYDIYTKAEDDAVIDKIFISTLYDSFMKNMSNLEETGVIADFVPFAYDWRLQLDDLLKMTKDPLTDEVRLDISAELEDGYLYQTIQTMVDQSLSGDVTIVAHSNGGLLAKTFMSALQAKNDPLLEKIDNIILVASPQVGTPDAVVGMLQGSEIGAGYIASQATTRQLLNTAPFGHHLLPNQNYFNGAGVQILSPVISFTAGTSTNDWIDAFGSQITDSETLHHFLSKDSGRPKPQTSDLKHPEVVDNFLLNYADTIAAVIDSWDPDPKTKVYQIAGTGIETTSGITYFADQECVTGGFLWFDCTEYTPKLGYYINFTHDGDSTVVVPSALAMDETDGVTRLWLDLEQEGRVHNNILESSNLINFITTVVIESTSASDLPQSLSKTAIDIDAGERLRFFLHSPLDIYIVSNSDVTSSSTSDIPGVIYRRYGEVQYVSVPAGTNGLTLVMNGYAEGSFTLTVQEWVGENLVDTYTYTAVPTSDSAIIEVPLDTFNAYTTLQIDINGDGMVDGVVSAFDDVVVPVKEPISPQAEEVEVLGGSSGSVSQATDTTVRRSATSSSAGQVAGVSISADEQWYYKELAKILQDIAVLLGMMATQYEK